MNLVTGIKDFLSQVFRDRTQTLEEYILSNNPQDTLQVEQLERQYYAREHAGRMI